MANVKSKIAGNMKSLARTKKRAKMAASNVDGNNSTAYIIGDTIEQSRKGMTTSYSLSPSKFNKTAAPEYDLADIQVKTNASRVKQSSIFAKSAQPKKVVREDAEFEQAE
jgi:hypothetical protein